MYKVISTGSHGNAVLYHNSILIDCGVAFLKVKPYLYDIDIILLTHHHQDHFNLSTIKKLQFERPTLRIACGSFMLPFLEGLKNIDVLEYGKLYNYGAFEIAPIKLYHDCENFGYRIFKDEYKIIHCTDTYTLEGITAKGYDLFAIEHNYNEDTINESIAEHDAVGEFSHQRRSFNTHLSEQQARDFIFKNKGTNYEVLRLHESTTGL